MDPREEVINEWQDLYSQYFDLDLDFSNLKFPKDWRSDDNLVIIVSCQVSLHEVLEVIENEYGLEVESGYYPNASLDSDWSFLDDQQSENDYLIIVTRKEKPPVTFNSASFHDWLERDSPNGGMNFAKSVNLLERLLLEIYVYCNHGFHLDLDTHCSNKTVCVSPTFDNDTYSVYPAVGCDKNGGIYITQYEGSMGLKERGMMTGFDYSSVKNGNGGRTILFTYGKRDWSMQDG